MAITITWKGSVYQTNNTQSSVTSSPTWTPQANSLLVALVCTCYSSSPSDPTGVTGHGVTYSKLTLGASSLGTTHQLSIWVAKAGASPTSAAEVASVTSTNGTGDLIIAFEVTGAEVSGNALQAIVKSDASNNGAAGTSATVTLAAAADPNNRALTFCVQQSNNAPTTAGSWVLTAGAAGNFNTPATGAVGLFRNDAFDTAGAATVNATGAWRMVGIEIGAAKEASDPPAVRLTEVGAVSVLGPTAVEASGPVAAQLTEVSVVTPSVASSETTALAGSESPALLVAVTVTE